MISFEDSYSTYEYDQYYKILPLINDWSEDKERIKNGIKVDENFVYDSSSNNEWMTKDQLKKWLKDNKKLQGLF